jgi:DNA gyrase subunit B
MTGPTSRRRNTTHDWASTVDAEHLAEIRESPARFAPGGLLQLVLEVVAYAADEAASTGGGHCRVTHAALRRFGIGRRQRSGHRHAS